MRDLLNRYKVPVILLAIWLGVSTVFFLRVKSAKALTHQVEALQQEIAALPEPTARSHFGLSATFSWIDSIPDFLLDMTQWAKERSLEIVSIEPGQSKKEQGYTEQPVSLTLEGRYRAVGNYLSYLEDLPRPMQITGVRLSNPSDVAPDLKARLELVIYIRENP